MMNRSVIGSLVLATLFLNPDPALAAGARPEAPGCITPFPGGHFTIGYVHASSAAVREAPSETAELRGYLPITTELHVYCQQDDWLKVAREGTGRPAGWMRADLVGTALPTRELALFALDTVEAGNRVALRARAERALAFDPLDEKNFADVLHRVRKQGDEGLAQELEHRLAALRTPTVMRLPDEEKLLFVADGQVMSPLARLADGKLLEFPQLPDGEGRSRAVDRFENRYFAVGRPYYFITRGGMDGQALAKGRREMSCESLVSGYQRVAGKESGDKGLLANFQLGAHAAGPVLAVSEGQKRTAVGLVSAVLKAARVPAVASAHLLRNQLELSAIPAPGHAAPILVASAQETSYADPYGKAGQAFHSYNLLLVMEAGEDGAYKITHRVFDEVDSENQFSSSRLLTYADIDGDGQMELILAQKGYESWWYDVLGRAGKGWKVLVSGGSGGC